MLLDLNKNLIGVDRKEIIINEEPILLSKILGNLLWARSIEMGDCIKFSDMGDKIYNEGMIEIDQSDAEKIISYLKSFPNTEHFAWDGSMRKQVIEAIQDARDAEKFKKQEKKK